LLTPILTGFRFGTETVHEKAAFSPVKCLVEVPATAFARQPPETARLCRSDEERRINAGILAKWQQLLTKSGVAQKVGHAASGQCPIMNT
jgi:hypothetical protein